MLKDIFQALDKSSFEEFQLYMNEMFAKNQAQTANIVSVDYENIMAINEPSITLKDAQNNIKDLSYLKFYR